MSGTIPFSVNETIAGCLLPAQLPAYNDVNMSSAASMHNATKNTQVCTSFPTEGITPTAAFPTSFGYLEYTLVVYGIIGTALP